MLCLDCRYSLKGLTLGVCPECGRPFVASDPATFYVPNMFMVSPFWSRAPDRWHYAIAMTAAFLCIRSYWLTVTDRLYLIAGWGLWLGIALPLFARVCLRLVSKARHRLRVPCRAFWKRCIPLAIVSGVTVLVVQLELPNRLRYALLTPLAGLAADELSALPFNVIDVEGRYQPFLGSTLIAAFRVDSGVAVETRHVPEESSWERYERRDDQWRWLARFSILPPSTVRDFKGRKYRVAHLIGDWYLLDGE